MTRTDSYIICKRNAGLGDLLKNVAAAWLKAKTEGKKVIIDWYDTCYTGHGRNIERSRDVCPFSLIFKPLRDIQGVNFYVPNDFSPSEYERILKNNESYKQTIDELLWEKSYHGPCRENMHFFIHSIASSLELVTGLQKRLDSFLHSSLISFGETLVACPFRYGDNNELRTDYIKNYEKFNPDKDSSMVNVLNDIFCRYEYFFNNIKEQHPAARPIFFCDHEEVYLKFHRLFSSSLPLPQFSRFSGENNAQHLCKDISYKDKLEEAALDMFFMKECKYMIYTNSAFPLLGKGFMQSSNTFRVW